jgi:hypothetical protein
MVDELGKTWIKAVVTKSRSNLGISLGVLKKIVIDVTAN